jgi:hypothetical protein
MGMETLEIITDSALIQQIKAETDIAIETAKKYPRAIEKVKANVLAYATCDEDTARSCFYKKPVDNKGTLVEGPSIRLAEIVAATYRNIKYGSRVIEITERWIKVQGIAMDLENNISYSVEIERSIWSDKGSYRYSQNLIETTTKAAAAIAIRDAIYKVVPMGIFNAEMKKIKEVAVGKNSGVPMESRVNKAIESFKTFGIDEQKILMRLDIVSRAAINEDHLETLIGLYNGIKDKEFTAEEAFVPYRKEAQEQKAKDVAEGVKGMMGNAGKVDKSGQTSLA